VLRAPIPNSKGNPVSGGAKYTRDGKILRFPTEINVYLGNGKQYEIGVMRARAGN